MSANYPNAAMIRRFAAIMYDSLLVVVAVWMPSIFIVNQLTNSDTAVTGLPFQLFLYAELFLFYFFFWQIKGQSLGMQVWKIRAVNFTGDFLSPKQALVRFFYATLCLTPFIVGPLWAFSKTNSVYIALGIFGLGVLWIAKSPECLTLYDKISNSRIIYLGNKPYESEKV